jgi:hypothetical protein
MFKELRFFWGEKMMGWELQKIMDAIEGSKSILNKLVSSSEEGLSTEETLKVSRDLDELLNRYTSMFQDTSECSQVASDFLQNENSFEG